MCFNQPVSSNCDRKFVDSLDTPCGWASLFNSFKELRMVWMLGMSACEERRREKKKRKEEKKKRKKKREKKSGVIVVVVVVRG